MIINKIKINTLIICTFLIAMSFSTVTTAQKHDEDEMIGQTFIENTTPYLFEKSRTKNIYTSTNDDRYRYVPNKIKPVLDNWRYQTDFFPVSAINQGLILPSEYEYGIKGLNISHYVPGELVIKLKPGVTPNIRYEQGIPQIDLASLDELNNRYNVRAMKPITIDKTRNNPLSQVYQLIIPEHTDMITIIKDYGKNPFVEYAEPNYIYHTYLSPNDPKFDQQWALHNTGQSGGTIDADIDAPEAWDIETGDPNVTIAVIDTGVDYLHPDLAGNIWVNPGEDLNHNGIAEGENFLDTGTDGLLDGYEPGFDPLTNPDPNGDNYDPETNPNGTEGNFKYDLGEPFDDFGIDAIGPDSLYYVGPDPDGSEGNGIYNPGDKDGIDSDGNNYIDDIRGWDYVGHIAGWPFPDNDPMDDHAHGTHCSGIISAVTNNGVGIAGVCWNITIMPLKFLDWSGRGSDVDGAKAIMYAVDNGADVISMSWGGPIPLSELLNEALVYAHENGVVLVAAAGNDNNEAPHYPSSSPYVISVAATDRDDVKASFSNYGLTVDVSAPGVYILSTVPEPGSVYHSFSGTSMACPHVAGLAGLLLSKNHSLTVEMVETIIVNSVDEVDSDVYIGSGRINAYKAIQREPAIALLDTPLDWDDAKGVIDINGTVWASDFQYYIVKYGKGRNPDAWVEIINSTIMVENSVLASLDTTVLDDGFYTIKLRLKCGIGGIYQDLTRRVVNNECNQFFVDDDNTIGPWDGTLEFPYQYIRDAVDDAGHYDTVYVFNGIYLGGFVVERSIELLGENKNNTVISQAYLDGIYIAADHVQISGFTVRDNWWGIQLAPLSKNCVVSGNIITENQQAGIGVLFSSYNNITDNEIINNPFGIYFYESTYNTVFDNTVRNSEAIGILILLTNNNLISANTIINSALAGIWIEYSLNNAVIDNNLMSTGICLWTTVLHPYNMIFWNTHTIENNVLNGKPIRYYKNMSDFVVPNNTAQVILANCTNVTIQNLNLLDTSMGIEIGYSSHITISENTIISNNGNNPGIILFMSSNYTINENSLIGAWSGIWALSYNIYGENIISNNIITDCGNVGISLGYSNDKSLISENIIKNCSWIGIYISSSSGSYKTISGNDIIDCGEGLAIDGYSDNNLVTDNNIRGNNEHGIWLWYAPNNTISGNVVINNKYGIDLSNFCDNNTIQGNTLFNNSMVGISIYNSKDNVIYHNNVIDTTWDNAYDSSNLSTWYNATLKQGNRWDDYTGIDEDGDGIGDTPYNISGGVNQDLYPLMSPYGGSVINIDTGKVFSSIQQSIYDATTLDGHTIYVCPDIYYENIIVNKAITLKGEKKESTIIDGNGSGDVVHMVADGVNMNGFTIRHSGLTHVGINISSNSNIISDNNITDNNVGVKILSSYLNSIISHNNFINNTLNACDYSTNAWDDGYPRGGNYWSDYTGEDTYYGPDQNIPGSDGIGDAPHNIPPGNNQDRYPLMNPWNGTLPPVPPSNTVYVDDDYNPSTPGWGYDHFDTIDDGIKAVAEQGTVIVKSGIYQGTYYGTSVMVNKTVTIIGENKYTTIIDGGGGELPAVYVMSANNVTIIGFTIKNSVVGIGVYWSDHTFISNTVITENDYGLILGGSSNSTIFQNMITNNNYDGIQMAWFSDGNHIYHNNFINNTQNAYDECINNWDDGYPSGGNYWDDFDEPSEGAYDNNSDGIVDLPYDIPGGDNVDLYPLTNPWTPALDTVYVDDDFNSSTPGWQEDHFDKIQDGIDAVTEGGTAFVYSGIYYENVKVNKSVNLIGEGREYVTVSAASSYDNVFEISDDYVNISGFTVTGDPESTIGIYSASTDNCNVYNNNVTNNHFGIYLDSADNNTLLNNIVNLNNNSGIVLIFSYNNVLINNTANSNIGGGIGLGYSSFNMLINNTADSNQEGGIILGASSNNTLLNNTANSNNYYGICLYFSSNNNIIENNRLSWNSKDIYNTGVNTFISNRFFHNLQSCMLTFEEVNRWKNLSDVVRFNISMFNANGDPSGCNYSITTRPVETVLISKNGNNITGNFTLSRLGTYSLLVIITDENNNTAKRRYTFFVNPSGLAKTRYYLRSVDPTHGQPTGSDAGSLLFTPPTEEESWWCSTWIQNSPDELPENYPLSILDDIDIYSWYKTQVEGYMGVQRFVTFGIEVDTSESVEAVAEYTWIHKNFGNLNWSMDYSWMWYLLSLKLKGYMPHWMTIPSQPSYANFTHRYTTTPTIKSISNPDIIILSATSPANNTNNANIVLEGSGTTTLVVQMLNTSLIYSVKLDGIACNNSNCTFTQQNGELNISLRLGSELNEHTLDIEGISNLSDLIIIDFSAEYLCETSTHISAECNSHTRMKLTAAIKNNGTADITIPFQVSFYGINAQTDAEINCLRIGTVEIPSLAAGETAEATIYWKLQPEISIIQVFADSTRVIEESNESNNRASVTIPSYLPWKSLKETVEVYSKLSQQYETPSAEKAAVLAKEAISSEVYVNPKEYVKSMKEIAEIEYKVGKELEGQVQPALLQKYQKVVKKLITVIDELMKDDTSTGITWEDAKIVAELQLQVCEIVEHMIGHKDIVHLDIQKTIGAK